MPLRGPFRLVSMWLRTSPLANRLLIVLRPPRPTAAGRRSRLLVGGRREVEVILDRRIRARGTTPIAYGPAGWRGERRQRIVTGRGEDARAVIARHSLPGLDYTPVNRTKGEDRMMSVESKQTRDEDEVRRWLEAGQTQLASLLELLHEHERLRERVEASERENERLRGVTYENEQLRNRLETSERQGEHLRQSVSELRSENDRHQKEREEAAERLNHLVNEIAQRLRPSAGAPRS